jgi:Na+-translocating ferredoxin:NAD+ oxidoreductase RnfD subunit
MFDVQQGIVADGVFGPRPLDLAHTHRQQSIADLAGPNRYEWLDLVLGYTPGPVGGASGLALILGLLLLVFAGAVSWLIPFFALLTLAAGLTLCQDQNVAVHLLSTSTLLGFFYLAADPASMPRTKRGKILAGIALGALELLLRIFLSEGTFISAVVVQSLSIVFDQYLAPPKESLRPPEARMKLSPLGKL